MIVFELLGNADLTIDGHEFDSITDMKRSFRVVCLDNGDDFIASDKTNDQFFTL